ncbi:MAG: SOS response-associated peptidase [Methanomicrobiales archaeon]|jgi:putative SOS response-associated peptidase YedK|nr:SOS response-associated peptidase [Methanomicrobiales archaeon]
MCGRFSIAVTAGLRERFSLDFDPLLFERYNISPGQEVPVVVGRGGGEATLVTMRWGMVPPWARDHHGAEPIINARVEGLSERPAFRDAYFHRRCIIPATGFFEWGNARSQKVPWYFRTGGDGILGLAGLFETRSTSNGDLPMCVIITVAANEVVTPVHPRMPAILPRTCEGRWLDPTIKESNQLFDCLVPCPGGDLEGYRVSQRVNNPAHEGPGLIRPISEVLITG